MPDLPDDACDASPIERADAHVATAASAWRDHPAVAIAGALSEVADQPPLIAISSLTLVAGLVAGRPRVARAGARMLAAHLLATWIKSVVKDHVDRTRPNLLVDEAEYRMEPGRSRDGEQRSFPSGHTAGMLAVTRALAREYPAAVLPGAILTTAVAAIQVPRCAHYPSDLAGGAVVGWAAEATVDELARHVSWGRDDVSG